jgi:hypothetical protein
MEPVWWDFEFQHVGETFGSKTMVNASRSLYGDAVRTMVEVRNNEVGHGVMLGVGPVVRKTDLVGGLRREEVVLKGVVHIRRKV